MLNTKPLLKYFLSFSLLYVLLLGFFSIPKVRTANAKFIHKTASVFMSQILRKAFVVVEEDNTKAKDPNIARIVYGNQSKVNQLLASNENSQAHSITVPMHEHKIYLQEFFVTPMLFLFALIGFMPIAFRRKIKMLVVGTLLLYLFLLIKLLCYTLFFIASDNIGIYEAGPFGYAVLEFCQANLKIGASIIVATFIWIMLAFDKSTWQANVVAFQRT